MNADYRQRALRLFPAGSNGEYGIPPELIPVLSRGRGCRVWETSGREFLDMTMAWGAALVGHAHPKVIEAAQRQAADGANFAAVNARAIELAERICAISPCAERIRFVASGTEATMLCLRVAIAATGRPKVLKFEGGYHGQHPVGVTSLLNRNPIRLARARRGWKPMFSSRLTMTWLPRSASSPITRPSSRL
jgi:glutamate-1-semialdehyde 2,1-aminomutase